MDRSALRWPWRHNSSPGCTAGSQLVKFLPLCSGTSQPGRALDHKRLEGSTRREGCKYATIRVK